MIRTWDELKTYMQVQGLLEANDEQVILTPEGLQVLTGLLPSMCQSSAPQISMAAQMLIQAIGQYRWRNPEYARAIDELTIEHDEPGPGDFG